MKITGYFPDIVTNSIPKLQSTSVHCGGFEGEARQGENYSSRPYDLYDCV